jgi:hypothetical protein
VNFLRLFTANFLRQITTIAEAHVPPLIMIFGLKFQGCSAQTHDYRFKFRLVHGSEINTTNLKQVMQKLVYLQRKIEWIMERIPIFPLSAVVFPGEYFNLHIFEPRYKQLIQDVELGKTTFGIPYIDNKTPGDYGSEVRLHKILNRYPGGELDITVEGIGIFEIEAYEGSAQEKLYNEGLVSKRIESTSFEESVSLGLLLQEYLSLGKTTDTVQQTEPLLTSYEAAIILGMHPAKKYSIIQLNTEQKRQIWLSNELKLLIQSRKMELQLDRKFILN